MAKCDIVVVGAGPAGSIAAMILAGNGLDVMVLEKKQEIGPPKRCAEGISLEGLRDVSITPHPRWAVNEIFGAVLYSPSGSKIEIRNENVMGCVLERKFFEKMLAADAIRAGAKYLLKTQATGVLRDCSHISGIRAIQMGRELEIE